MYQINYSKAKSLAQNSKIEDKVKEGKRVSGSKEYE